MIRRFVRSCRLVYLVARGAIHVHVVAPLQIGRYCESCSSVIERLPDRGVRIIGTKPCPLHVAWKALIEHGIEP